ncbi:MAG: cell division ATPase MinD [archaeon]
MTRVIAIASGKGGVGKTTATANIGIALAELGQKVLLVDADIAMANLSLLLGMQSSPITLHDVLLGDSSVQDAIYEGPKGVHFIPSGLSLESYRRVDSERLASVVQSVSANYDFVLLDVAAGIEKNVLSAINAADEVLLITDPTSPSIADVFKTKVVTQRLGSKPLGIILNFVRGEKGEIADDEVMKMLELPIYGRIPFDPEVRRSFMQEHALPVVIRKPSAPSSIAFRKTASKLTGQKVELNAPKKEGGLKRFLNKLFSIFRRGK